LAVTPEILYVVATQIPKKFILRHLRFDGVDALNVTALVMSGIDCATHHQTQ
jgi:hypothetical protein